MGGERPLTRKDLNQIYYLNRRLADLKRRLETYKAEASVQSKVMDGMPYPNTNEISDPTFNAVSRADMLREKAKKAIEGLTAEIEIRKYELDIFLTTIDDLKLQAIIDYRCRDCMDWVQVAECIGGDSTAESCRKAYSRFIKTLDCT